LPKPKFEELLLQAIDEGLTTLGESSRTAIYFHLEKSFNIKKHQIPEKTENFAEAIEQIFGVGADFLEILIMKQLYEKVGRSFKWQPSKNLEFTEYVAAVKQSFLKKNNSKETADKFVQPKTKKLITLK